MSITAPKPLKVIPQPLSSSVRKVVQTVTSWGNQRRQAVVLKGERLAPLAGDANLARGLGRSYGDSALPSHESDSVVDTTLADRILAFDPETGAIRAEAGLSLFDLNRLFLRRGFFCPVSPGTQFVTLGGMVASDVHGKMSHVAGCFGSHHVASLLLQVADGRLIECGPNQEPELFWGTVGGMGLTGHILEVEFSLEKIRSPWVYSQSQRIPNIDAFMDQLHETGPKWPHGVGWIDCVSRGKNMGRGILDVGRWATPEQSQGQFLPTTKRASVPFFFPEWAINPLTVRAFNSAYYHKHVQRKREGIVHPDQFFYPLDAILNWNRVYGRRGFTQYQCILPRAAGRGAARHFLDVLTKQGGASPLCVIKDCGEEGKGMLSFPMPGISIALDIAIRSDTQRLVDRLNQVVIELGGRIYLTKDLFTRAEDFRRMEPRLDAFLKVREKWDPNHRISSAQSLRLFGR